MKGNGKTRTLTLSALLAALTLVSHFAATVWPSGDLSIAAFSAIFTAAAVIESGIGAGFYVFACSSLLSLLVMPSKSVSFLYLMFFGYYPIAKNFIERVRSMPAQWALKIALFNVALLLMYLLIKELVFDFGSYSPGYLIIAAAGTAIFALYDYGFSKVISLYMTRVHKK
ncbi:MAG: hypothetical protein FWG48_06140 [Oscillospiraceae bacterium]|nr:hypothetical protein [Oscillospiraceae bacterium]